jgi:hypothetical protein
MMRRVRWSSGSIVLLGALGLAAVGCRSATATGPTTGSLEVVVTGLPSGPAAITVVGPDGVTQTVTATTTLSNLTPGLYLLAASPVLVAAATYTSNPDSKAVTVAASATATVATFAYTLATGSLRISVTGLPSGPAAITVAGPAGFTQTVTATTTLSNLTPGVYTLTASPVLVSSAAYTSTPGSTTVTVTASVTPAIANVAYALATGSLHVTVTGLPSGPATISVSGPFGFNQIVTSSATLPNLAPGTYTLQAYVVVVATAAYAANSPTTVVTVAATATTATVVYTPASLSLLITVISPYAGSPPVGVLGPSGFKAGPLPSGTVLKNLIPGGYTIFGYSTRSRGGPYPECPVRFGVPGRSLSPEVHATFTYSRYPPPPFWVC